MERYQTYTLRDILSVQLLIMGHTIKILNPEKPVTNSVLMRRK